MEPGERRCVARAAVEDKSGCAHSSARRLRSVGLVGALFPPLGQPPRRCYCMQYYRRLSNATFGAVCSFAACQMSWYWPGGLMVAAGGLMLAARLQKPPSAARMPIPPLLPPRRRRRRCRSPSLCCSLQHQALPTAAGTIACASVAVCRHGASSALPAALCSSGCLRCHSKVTQMLPRLLRWQRR